MSRPRLHRRLLKLVCYLALYLLAVGWLLALAMALCSDIIVEALRLCF